MFEQIMCRQINIGEKLGLKTNFKYMKTGLKKYYRKLESYREFDEDPNFDKPNFKPTNKKHRRNMQMMIA